MACDVSTLLNDACDNGFLKIAQNETLSRGVILQLFYDTYGNAETLDELIEQACTNSYLQVSQNETMWRYLVLQNLCNLGGD